MANDSFLIIRILYSFYEKYSFCPGYCNVSNIIKVRGRVKNVKVGDRVASLAGHVEYVIINEEELVKVSDEISDEETTFHTKPLGS